MTTELGVLAFGLVAFIIHANRDSESSDFGCASGFWRCVHAVRGSNPRFFHAKRETNPSVLGFLLLTLS